MSSLCVPARPCGGARPRRHAGGSACGRTGGSAHAHGLSRAFAVALALGVAAAGCVAPTVSLKPESQYYTAADYDRVYERWTRFERQYDFAQLRSVLNATATFESPEFRWAYVVRYARDYGLPPETRTAMLRDTLVDAEHHHRFFVTLGNGRPRELDLTSADGAFRIVLVDDRGRHVAPVEIARVRKTSAAERAYFPSISKFRQAFRVTFPAVDEHGAPTIDPAALFAVLRLTGPTGQVDLKWEFRESVTGKKRVVRR
jgi:hypothetical protein